MTSMALGAAIQKDIRAEAKLQMCPRNNLSRASFNIKAMPGDCYLPTSSTRGMGRGQVRPKRPLAIHTWERLKWSQYNGRKGSPRSHAWALGAGAPPLTLRAQHKHEPGVKSGLPAGRKQIVFA